MPQTRARRPESESSTTGPVPETQPAEASGDNAWLADVLAGRTRVDGDAATWFQRGLVIQRGMKGDVIAELQRIIGASADGDFGPGTERALKAWQVKNGETEDAMVDASDWNVLQKHNAKTFSKPEGQEAFDGMWAAHPHNYLPDASQNTDSGDLNEELGFDRNMFGNTCALRLSTMLNRMGGEYRITKDKAKAAGLDKMRESGMYLPRANDPQTAAQDDRVIVSAKEMWTYLEHHMGKPEQIWPSSGRNLYRADAEKAAEAAEAACASRKGFVCFDNMQLKDESGEWTGYGGSGHVDIFDGGQLSDGDWYPAQRILVWFVV
jgi:hypothetical protein